MDNKLIQIINKFDIEGEVLSVNPFGAGHINKTFLVITTKKKYIFQQINNSVFPDMDGLMENIKYITSHLRAKGVETLDYVCTKDNKNYIKGDECYRIFVFIEGTKSYNRVENREVFKNAGRAFGEFQNYLADFDASVLTETIKRFHDTPKRFNDFTLVLTEDKLNRAKTCKKEIDFIISHKDTFGLVTEGLKDKTIPLRVTHNDTKLNNILIDEKTNKVRAIIDLDTIMPGSVLYDFGDSIRFGANDNEEDEKDLSKVNFNIDLYKAYSEGFLSAVKNSLNKKEIELLPYGAYLMTVECGMRFLTDYLQGDTYFATQYPEHNLVRARTQLKLASEMENRFDEMSAIIKELI